jgi:cell wall assembly regulator SMI1
MLAVKARMVESASAGALVDAINRVEADLGTAFPAVQWMFFEPDDKN